MSCQSTVNHRARSGDSDCGEANIPADEVWWQLVVDKGGTATKLILKLCCDIMADSVRHVVLLGIFDRVADKYDMYVTAFGPIYEQMNVINQTGGCVWAPWFQHARQSIILREADLYPVSEDPTLARLLAAPLAKGTAVEVTRAAAAGPQVTAAARAASIASRREASAVAAEARQSASTLAMCMATEPGDIIAAAAALVAVTAVTPTAVAPTATATPAAPKTMAEAEQASRALRIMFANKGEANAFPESPPSETIPECEGCAEFGMCVALRKNSHFRNPPGRVRPKHFEHTPAPRLQGCTWSASCADCLRSANGELRALQRQHAATSDHGWALRRNRIFSGGDWMSQTTPLGHQGPVSKNFCWACWAVLHETSKPGVACLPCTPDDPRPRHIANPALRVGASYTLLNSQRVAAEATGARVEAADYGSVINLPLQRVAADMTDTCSTTPLHLLLGIGMELVNSLEAYCKKLDADLAMLLGLTADDEKIAAAMIQLMTNLTTAIEEVEEHQSSVSTHVNSLQKIVDSPNSGEAVERGQRKRPRSKSYVALPLEDEYREHTAKLAVAVRALAKTESMVEKRMIEHQELWGRQGGPRYREFNEMFEAFNLQRQAYLNATMNGWDIWRFFQQDAIDDFTKLIAPRFTHTPAPAATTANDASAMDTAADTAPTPPATNTDTAAAAATDTDTDSRDTTPHHATPHHTTPYHSTPHHSTPLHTPQHHTTPHHTQPNPQ